VPIVRSHHESWDGTGYPDGLQGEDIPIGARLLTAVDCFDALASERPYRKALPLDEAMAFVMSRAGIQFDPQIAALLAEHYLELEAKARKQIDDFVPLKTDLAIIRGAAPGAGFEPESPVPDASDKVARVPAFSIVAGQNQPDSQSPDLFAAARQAVTTISALGRITGRALNAREICYAISISLRSLVPFDCIAIYVRSGESLLPHFLDCASGQAMSMQKLPIGAGLSGWVAENARSIVNGNPTVEPNYLPDSGVLTAASSALSIPLFDRSGAAFGVLSLYASASAAFSKDHLRILQGIEPEFSIVLQDAIRRKAAEAPAYSSALESLAAS